MEQHARFDYKGPGLQVFHYWSNEELRLKFHSHGNHIELWCLISGKATFLVEGTEYRLQPGDLMVIRPGEVHTPVVDYSVPFERASVVFSPQIFSMLTENESFWEPVFNRQTGTRNLYRAVDMDRDIRYYYAQMQKSSKDQRLNILTNTLLLMRHINAAYARKAFTDGTSNEPAHRILYYINDNLERDLSVQALCQEFYISSAHLERIIKKVTGDSVGKYVTAKRLLLARQMILEGNKPTQICAACGYSNYASFYRAYTKYFGHTPKRELQDPTWNTWDSPTKEEQP